MPNSRVSIAGPTARAIAVLGLILSTVACSVSPALSPSANPPSPTPARPSAQPSSVASPSPAPSGPAKPSPSASPIVKPAATWSKPSPVGSSDQCQTLAAVIDSAGGNHLGRWVRWRDPVLGPGGNQLGHDRLHASGEARGARSAARIRWRTALSRVYTDRHRGRRLWRPRACATWVCTTVRDRCRTAPGPKRVRSVSQRITSSRSASLTGPSTPRSPTRTTSRPTTKAKRAGNSRARRSECHGRRRPSNRRRRQGPGRVRGQ